MADRQPHSHNTYTHPHTHTQMDKITTSKHSTKHKYKLICLMIKLHTVHHTTEDAITQSADGVHPGGEEWFQRTLAVKQHPPVVENCPSRQRGEPLLSFSPDSPDSESALFNRKTCNFSRCSDGKQKQKENTLGSTFEMSVVDSHQNDIYRTKHWTCLNTVADCN